MEYFLLPILVFILSFISGMLGLGVAFISTPVLGLFGFELKHVLMPWSLLLNGLTATSAAVAYTRSKMVDWRTAVPLLVITTIAAPLGVWLLQFVPTDVVWWIYVGVLIFLAYRMAFGSSKSDSEVVVITDQTRVKGGLFSAAIGVFRGFPRGRARLPAHADAGDVGLYSPYRRCDEQCHRDLAIFLGLYRTLA